MSFETIAIIGGGVMGCATALDLARSGYNIILKEISINALEKAPKIIKSEYRSACLIDRNYATVSLKDIFEKIHFQLDYANVDAADLIIENIIENESAKIAEYERLSSLCKKDVIFAINTSCISITKLASHLPTPENVIGVHWMNPVPLKRTVEVIRGHLTSPATEKNILIFLGTLQKTGVVINDFPGFVTNRLSHLLMNEAACIVQDGVATAKQIDDIMKHGLGHKMGPLETADLIGLDTVVDSLNVLYQSYQDPKYRCSVLLRRMVDAGFYGRKNGRGFYEY